MKKAVLFWSGGKDSALAYYKILQEKNFQIVGLISTIDINSNRIPFHGVNEKQVVLQAKMLGVPLLRIFLPTLPSNEQYIEKVGSLLKQFKQKGIEDVIFGDIYLEDIKNFRDSFLKELGLNSHYPLWGTPPHLVAQEFIDTGHRAVVTSIKRDVLEDRFLNKEYNLDFINSLPEGIDPTLSIILASGSFIPLPIMDPTSK